MKRMLGGVAGLGPLLAQQVQDARGQHGELAVLDELAQVGQPVSLLSSVLSMMLMMQSTMARLYSKPPCGPGPRLSTRRSAANRRQPAQRPSRSLQARPGSPAATSLLCES